MRKGAIPFGGWNAVSFIDSGATLVTDMVRQARYSRKRRQAGLAAALELAMLAQANEVIAGIILAAGGSADSQRLKWATVLDAVFGPKHDATIEDVVRPDIQSVLAQGVEKTAVLLGVKLPDNASATIITPAANRMAKIAVTINRETRAQIDAIISKRAESDASAAATAAAINESFPAVAAWRADMIARTELNNAYTQGSIQTYKRTPLLSHVSVVGCTGVNDSKWNWRGIPTCNISMVPVDFAHELTWHPNHAGALVASKFLLA